MCGKIKWNGISSARWWEGKVGGKETPRVWVLTVCLALLLKFLSGVIREKHAETQRGLWDTQPPSDWPTLEFSSQWSQMFPCRRRTWADPLSSPLFSSRLPPDQWARPSPSQKRPPHHILGQYKWGSCEIRANWGSITTSQISVHKGAGFRKTTAFDACLEFLPWQSTVRKISPRQCTLGCQGRAAVFSGIKLPAGPRSHPRELLVSPEDLAVWNQLSKGFHSPLCPTSQCWGLSCL